jgi:hypothetical protein
MICMGSCEYRFRLHTAAAQSTADIVDTHRTIAGRYGHRHCTATTIARMYTSQISTDAGDGAASECAPCDPRLGECHNEQ